MSKNNDVFVPFSKVYKRLVREVMSRHNAEFEDLFKLFIEEQDIKIPDNYTAFSLASDLSGFTIVVRPTIVPPEQEDITDGKKDKLVK
jgi:hypothetical protein